MTTVTIHITDSTVIIGQVDAEVEESETFTAMNGAGKVLWTAIVDDDPGETANDLDPDFDLDDMGVDFDLDKVLDAEEVISLRAELAEARRELYRLNREVSERVRGYEWMVNKADRLARQCDETAEALGLMRQERDAATSKVFLLQDEVEHADRVARQRGETLTSLVQAVQEWNMADDGAPKMNAYRRIMRIIGDDTTEKGQG